MLIFRSIHLSMLPARNESLYDFETRIARASLSFLSYLARPKPIGFQSTQMLVDGQPVSLFAF